MQSVFAQIKMKDAAIYSPLTQRLAMGTAFSSYGIQWNQVNPLAIP